MNCTEKEGILKKILYQVREEGVVLVAGFFLLSLSSFQFCLNGFT